MKRGSNYQGKGGMLKGRRPADTRQEKETRSKIKQTIWHGWTPTKQWKNRKGGAANKKSFQKKNTGSGDPQLSGAARQKEMGDRRRKGGKARRGSWEGEHCRVLKSGERKEIFWGVPGWGSGGGG